MYHAHEYEKKIDENMTQKMFNHINVGCGKDLTIESLALMIKDVVGFNGEVKFDSRKPDGTPQKLLNSDRIKSLNWTPKTNLKDGLLKTYEDYLKSL